MEQAKEKATILFFLSVLAVVALLVDEPWVRVGLGLVPALLLAHRALGGVGVGSGMDVSSATDRRTNAAVRGHIDDLLVHFRNFYTTCQLMAGGKLEPEEAKSLAVGIERRMHELLAGITAAAGAEREQT